MMNYIKACLVGFLFAGLPILLPAQSEGWKLFADNKMKEAYAAFEAELMAQRAQNITAFTEQATTPAGGPKADMLLGMALIADMQNKPKQAASLFRNYFESSKDEAALFALWGTSLLASNAGAGTDAADYAFIQRIADDANINGSLRTIAYQSLINYFEEKDNFPQALSYRDKTGTIKEWMALGEFQNISGSGFQKDWGVLSGKQTVFKNKNNYPVNWFRIEGPRLDGWVDLQQHFIASNSIIYVQTFIRNPQEQTVDLRLGTSGSFKLWLDDALLMQEEEERNNDLDTYISRIKLKEGNHRLLIQLGESELGRCNFLMRITDEKGNALNGITYSADPLAYDKASNLEGQAIPLFAEQELEGRIKAKPGELMNYLLLIETYLHNDKTYQARQYIKEAEKIAPNCLYLLQLKSNAFSRDNNSSGNSTVLKQMKDIDSTTYLSLNMAYEEAKEQDNWDLAEKLAARIKELYGDDENATMKDLDILSHNQQNEKLIELVNQAFEKYPDNLAILYLKYLIVKEVDKNSKKANKLLSNYLKTHYSSYVWSLISQSYFDAGDFDKGIAIYEDYARRYPGLINNYEDMFDMYRQARRYDEAEKYSRRCIEMAPYVSRYQADMADILKEKGDESAAQAYYEKAILMAPTNYDAREKLRKLKNEKAVFDYFSKPDFEALFKSSPKAADYPEDNSLILLNEIQKVVHSGGASEEMHYVMIKMFNASGVDAWKEYGLSVYNNQRVNINDAYIIKANGQKTDAERGYSGLVFTNLEIGDAICVSYKVQNYYYGKLAEHFWDQHYFSLYYPCLESRYSLLINPSTTFKYEVSNSDLQPQISTVDNLKKYVWEKRNIASIKPEPKMPRSVDFGEVLHISTFPDWDYIAKWYVDLSAGKAKPDFEVKEVAAEILANKANATEYAKAKAIYDYIVKNIRYSSLSFRQSGLVPQRAREVINTRLGDCKDVSTLFVALAREAGIEAKLVLVNTRENGMHAMELPSIDFNHCIATAKLDGKPYYIELTSDLNPFAALGEYTKNAFTLVIEADSQRKANPVFLDPATRVQNSVYRYTQLQFDGSAIRVKKRTVKTGDNAASSRSAYRDIGKDQQEKEMKEALADEFSNLKLSSLKFDANLNSTSDSVSYEYEYKADEGLQDLGGIYTLKTPWAEKIQSVDFLSEDSRRYPIELWKFNINDKEMETIQLTIPSGMSLIKLPESSVLTNDFFDYRMTYTMEGKGSLRITREMSYKVGVVPTNQYTKFKDDLQKVIKQDNQAIAFK